MLEKGLVLMKTASLFCMLEAKFLKMLTFYVKYGIIIVDILEKEV